MGYLRVLVLLTQETGFAGGEVDGPSGFPSPLDRNEQEKGGSQGLDGAVGEMGRRWWKGTKFRVCEAATS